MQRSSEWKSDRLGVITGTRAHSLMGSKIVQKTLMAEMIAEIAMAKSKEFTQTLAMKKGADVEPEAVKYYEFMNNYSVHGEDDYIVSDFNHRFAVSPDGLVGDIGGVEIKSLDPHNHIKVIIDDDIDKKYLAQIEWALFVQPNREWWDYFGYQPELPEPIKGYKKRFILSDKKRSEYLERGEEFLSELDEILERLELSL